MFDFDFTDQWDVDKASDLLTSSLFGTSRDKQKQGIDAKENVRKEINVSLEAPDSDDEQLSKKERKRLKEMRRKQKKSGLKDKQSLDPNRIPDKAKKKTNTQDGLDKQNNDKKNSTSKKKKKNVGVAVESEMTETAGKKRKRSSSFDQDSGAAANAKKKAKLSQDQSLREVKKGGGKTNLHNGESTQSINASGTLQNVTEGKKKKNRKKKNTSKKNKEKQEALKSKSKPSLAVISKDGSELVTKTPLETLSAPLENSKFFTKKEENFSEIHSNLQGSTELFVNSNSSKTKSKQNKRHKKKNAIEQDKSLSYNVVNSEDSSVKSNTNYSNNLNIIDSVKTEPKKKKKQLKTNKANSVSHEDKAVTQNKDGPLVTGSTTLAHLVNVSKGSGQSFSQSVAMNNKLVPKNSKLAPKTNKFVNNNELTPKNNQLAAKKNKLTSINKIKLKDVSAEDKEKTTPQKNTVSSKLKKKQEILAKMLKNSLEKNKIEKPEFTSKKEIKKTLKSSLNIGMTSEDSNKLDVKPVALVQQPTIKPGTPAQPASMWGKAAELGNQAREKLKSARFRYINEQLYSCTGRDALTMFKADRDAFSVYHEGYENQVSKWPVNPVSVIIKQIKDKPANLVIADFGCGDAKIAQSIPHKVHSFDLVAVNDRVTACEMSKTPLPNESVDIAIFCLSLMGTNISDYIHEANRVLKTGGILKIAEVVSRFSGVSQFIGSVSKHGFLLLNKRDLNQMFYMIDFKKVKTVKKSASVGPITLKPCVYKRR
ncbi:ribosomal RNA-processing protein 8-like [Physella acuta]|uniref:ribosomal RNA-processing protein 8-like n=1 Tax=Physella acuta TaxID=109671 RepID=UPI0027DCD325|nr:ribosomal RNA-processing protein 8-like [Physella acuta]XP_059150752.1 ribosomal RNA-processing protein 8-like [Physella acuta]